jgi:glycosyltransferase involved in cell wall biosynthesis
MTTTCLINNYNYGHFIGQAVDSALGQTVPFDQIIVVDDGSTDGSVDLLAGRYSQQPAVQVIAKDNQGQLSCFNEGFARTTGDIVFFLDADDVYEPNYVESALDLYSRHPHVDFVSCGHRQFDQQDRLNLEFSQNRDLGYSVILTAYLRQWIGAPTSCISMRRGMLEKILPLPFLEMWRTRADDCLVFGASLAGARKYYLAQPLVRYRVHDQNQFFGHASNKFAVYRRRLAINALFQHMESKFCYDVQRLAEFHHREFCTIARPTLRQLKDYARISMALRASLFRRLACLVVMTGHVLSTAMRSAKTPSNRTSPPVDYDSTVSLHMFVPATSTADTEARRPPESQRHAA